MVDGEGAHPLRREENSSPAACAPHPCERCPSSQFREPKLTKYGASFNVPMYDGQPREYNLIWTMTKGGKTARCAMWTHPIGAELRVSVGGELVNSEARRDILALVDMSVEWQKQFHDKGWNPCTGSVISD